MVINITGEQLGIDNEELLDIEFYAEVDDDALEGDFIQIESVSNDSECDILHLINQEYAKRFIRPMIDKMKDDVLTQTQAERSEIDI